MPEKHPRVHPTNYLHTKKVKGMLKGTAIIEGTRMEQGGSAS